MLKYLRTLRAKKESGFTLLELLLVVAAIAILATIVFAVLSPADTLNKFRDANRTSNIQAILSSMQLYAIDHNGDVPNLATGTQWDDLDVDTYGKICKASTATACDIVLDDLLEDSKYLVSVPTDPSYDSGTDGENTKYWIKIIPTTGVVTVRAIASDGSDLTAVGKFNAL